MIGCFAEQQRSFAYVCALMAFCDMQYQARIQVYEEFMSPDESASIIRLGLAKLAADNALISDPGERRKNQKKLYRYTNFKLDNSTDPIVRKVWERCAP